MQLVVECQYSGFTIKVFVLNNNYVSVITHPYFSEEIAVGIQIEGACSVEHSQCLAKKYCEEFEWENLGVYQGTQIYISRMYNGKWQYRIKGHAVRGYGNRKSVIDAAKSYIEYKNAHLIGNF